MAFWGRKKIKIVYFDVGGVLVDADLERYVPICCAKFRTTPEPLIREVVARVPALERAEMGSLTFWREIGESLWRQGQGNLADDHDFYQLWRDIMSASLVVNTEVIKLCQMLADNGIRLGILSNAIEEHATLLKERGIYAPFNPCIVSCYAKMRKPEESIYRLAIEQAKVRPSECLFVDDLEFNVEIAKRVGMEGYVFTDARGLAEELLRRDLIRV